MPFDSLELVSRTLNVLSLRSSSSDPLGELDLLSLFTLSRPAADAPSFHLLQCRKDRALQGSRWFPLRRREERSVSFFVSSSRVLVSFSDAPLFCFVRSVSPSTCPSITIDTPFLVSSELLLDTSGECDPFEVRVETELTLAFPFRSSDTRREVSSLRLFDDDVSTLSSTSKTFLLMLIPFVPPAYAVINLDEVEKAHRDGAFSSLGSLTSFALRD